MNENKAMQSTAVLACVRILSETLANLPLLVYRRLGQGRERAKEHSLYKLLMTQPNPEMTAFTFKETMMAHLLLWGNCYAEIEFDQNGKIIALWPIPPNMVDVIRTPRMEKAYRIYMPNGGGTKTLPDYAILHIPGLGFDGQKGFSVIQMNKRAIELTQSAEIFGNKFFKNGTHTGGVLEYPDELSDVAYERLKKSFEKEYEGLERSHRVLILEQGAKFNKISVPPNDAQFLETRRFQISEIARMFRVPPHMLADLDRATFSNIEHQSIEFVVHTVTPWLKRWEQAIQVKLLRESEQDDYYAEFLVDALLRGDSASRSEFYTKMFNMGVMSQNEIRALENMNPIEGGDVHFVPLNMVPIEDVEKANNNLLDEA